MDRPVTVWKRWDKKNRQWAHNHIEEGHSQRKRPEPGSEAQKEVWPGLYWKRFHRFIDENQRVFTAFTK